jgi:hypothetical protein
MHALIYRVTRRRIFGFDLRALYGIVLEMRSFSARIRFLRERKLYRYGTFLGPTWERLSKQRIRRCTRTIARMKDMQWLVSMYPGATLVDRHLFLEGWNKGEQFHAQFLDNHCCRSECKAECTWGSKQQALETSEGQQ